MPSRPHKQIAVWGALIANAAIATTKFIAATITGSSAMLSEGIHSTIDCGNEILLLVGERRARMGPDEQHPYGHGKEIYFFALLVAVLLFAVGGGMSIYEGIVHLRHAHRIENPTWNLVVLGAAFVFEAGSLYVAHRQLVRRTKRVRSPARGLLVRLMRTKDASTMSIVAEDSAALVGVVIATVGVLLNHYAGIVAADAIASLAIGVLLCAVSAFLAWESRGLLVGEAAAPAIVAQIRSIAMEHPSIKAVTKLLTMHLGPDEILVNVEICFRPSTGPAEVQRDVSDIENSVRRNVPFVRDVFVRARY